VIVQPSSTRRLVRLDDNVVKLPENVERLWQRAKYAYSRRDLKTALPILVELIDAGDYQAYSYLGNIFEYGSDEVEKDLSKALFYHERSVEHGYFNGYLCLARCYYLGKGVPKDFKKAFELYSIVAQEAGDAAASVALGRMYHRGHGVNRDLAKAREHWELAWRAGYFWGLVGLSLLERDEGRWVRGWWLRIKALVYGCKIMRRSRYDEHFRAY
jgi:TPR repeat protein